MDDRMAYLKSLLVSYKWRDFAYADDGSETRPIDRIMINKIQFGAGHGVHLGQPAVAVMAEGKFIVIRYLPEETNFINPLNPKEPMASGYIYRLNDSILNDKVIRET